MPSLWVAAAVCGLAPAIHAQAVSAPDTALRPIVITGAAPDRQRWVAPVSMDVIEGDEIRAGNLQVNLSESLARVPGLTILNRQNYAQDLQLSIRGFGARSTFGVRGLRLFVDGIPASAPDGQGQAGNFPLGSAQHIEVIRGPYSALYGASSGGVIALTTEDGAAPATWRTGFAAGGDGLWRLSTQASGLLGATGASGGLGYSLDVSTFHTDGFRAQSAADRSNANLKLARAYDGGRLTLLFNRQVGQALDPLGLSRAEFDANPRQTTPSAIQYNTRKTSDQTQFGVAWQQQLGAGHGVELIAYTGQRGIAQYQAIPPSTQVAATSPGAVIGLDRDYGGWNARWRLDRRYDSGRLTLSAGLAADRQSEHRLGWQNFTGAAASPAALGVQGALRRDDSNVASTLDPYAQLEWEARDWTLTAGVRHSRVKLDSADHYVVPGNPDDSGSARYAGTSPVLGLRHRLGENLQAWVSAGRGFETPTLNEVAYRASGAGGINTALLPSRSRSVEAGLRGRDGRLAWSAAAFDVRTRDEIVVLSNTGGRSTYQNAGRTQRRGLELSGEAQFGKLDVTSALTLMKAVYADDFSTCSATPCAVPDLRVPAGNRIPGIPQRQLYLQLAWEPGVWGATYTLEVRNASGMAVNDRNSDAAAGYTVVNLGARFQQDVGEWQWREFARIDNAGNRTYAGSVIVNEGNGRYFETAPRRALLVGLELQRRFR